VLQTPTAQDHSLERIADEVFGKQQDQIHDAAWAISRSD